MSLDPGMTQEATVYAQKIAKHAGLEHAQPGGADNPNRDGENLAMSCATNLESYTGDEPVKAWCDIIFILYLVH